MDPRYAIAQTDQIITPALVIFRDLVESNREQLLKMAGGPQRLRPHCKTHKLREITQLLLQRGITKHKCATLAEAEMLAECGVPDIFLAYNIVGPNIQRVVSFCRKFPQVQLGVTADHPEPIRQLGTAAANGNVTVDVLLDLDVGQHRTGVPVGPYARELYELISQTPGLRAAGFHVYDGHQHQTDKSERRAAIRAEFEPVLAFRKELEAAGFSVPKLVCGGTGSFPIYMEYPDPTIEGSPGTSLLHDQNYGEMFPDLEFTPAALVLTRVISRPTPDRITLDLGYKAVASDPPAGRRVVFPDLPDAEHVLQNEEHLVLKSAHAEKYQPGDELLAIPRHVCPTCALHRQVFVVSQGKLVDRWDVVARDRWITI